jgi:hypothetical protein
MPTSMDVFLVGGWNKAFANGTVNIISGCSLLCQTLWRKLLLFLSHHNFAIPVIVLWNLCTILLAPYWKEQQENNDLSLSLFFLVWHNLVHCHLLWTSCAMQWGSPAVVDMHLPNQEGTRDDGSTCLSKKCLDSFKGKK